MTFSKNTLLKIFALKIQENDHEGATQKIIFSRIFQF
jgi:hypothetical protein